MLAIRDLMQKVGGQLQAACPSCGKTLRVTRIMARYVGAQTADLWVSAMRRLADGSRRRAHRSVLRFFLESGQVVTHSSIVVSPAS